METIIPQSRTVPVTFRYLFSEKGCLHAIAHQQNGTQMQEQIVFVPLVEVEALDPFVNGEKVIVWAYNRKYDERPTTEELVSDRLADISKAMHSAGYPGWRYQANQFLAEWTGSHDLTVGRLLTLLILAVLTFYVVFHYNLTI